MTVIKDKPGRQMHMNVLVDHDRNRVQIIRNLHNTKGFLVNSGNMGWIPMDEWREFLSKQTILANCPKPTLCETFGYMKRES
jgi:hypothetical protein